MKAKTNSGSGALSAIRCSISFGTVPARTNSLPSSSTILRPLSASDGVSGCSSGTLGAAKFGTGGHASVGISVGGETADSGEVGVVEEVDDDDDDEEEDDDAACCCSTELGIGIGVEGAGDSGAGITGGTSPSGDSDGLRSRCPGRAEPRKNERLL